MATLLVKLPGLFVVSTVLSVFGSIFYLTQMARWLSLSACSPHLELSDAGIVLPQRLPGSHPLPDDITHHLLTITARVSVAVSVTTAP